MKTTSILVSLFTTAAFAAPSLRPRTIEIPTVTFSVINDVSGANAASNILADGIPLRFGDAFAATPLEQNGRIVATSAQLNTIVANVACVVTQGNGDLVGLLNERNTFVQLDGVEGAAVETDVTDFELVCEI